MSETSPTYKPIQYDTERAKLFFKRTANGKNLSRAYAPEYNVKIADAYIDAIIGFFYDEVVATSKEGSVNQERRFGQLAFALDFLQGMSEEDLKEQLKLATPGARKHGVEGYALDVAGSGSRAARVILSGEQRQEKKQSVTHKNLEFESDIEEFKDLDNFLRGMHEDGRLDAGRTQALLLLFEQQSSNAAVSLQNRMLHEISKELRERLSKNLLLQPRVDGRLADKTFAQGSEYIRLVTGELPPQKHVSRMKLLLAIKMSKATSRDQDSETVRGEVLGYIGHVLNQLYPPYL